MKPSKLYEALHALIGERVPLHIWGACGVGKSQIVSQVAKVLDYDFLDVRAVQLDPVDLRGLPRIAEDQTEWVPPKFLPTSGKGILFLDELTSAPQMTQAGCYQLVLDRKLGEYVLPDGWWSSPPAIQPPSVASISPCRDRCATGLCIWTLNRISTTGAGGRSRLWCAGDHRLPALQAGLLHTADATADANAWPTPRSWRWRHRCFAASPVVRRRSFSRGKRV